MAHGLRRVSYATCDPSCKQFCFLARQPGGHINKQYCHLFVTKTAEQVSIPPILVYRYIYIYMYIPISFVIFYKLQYIFFFDLIVREACERHDRHGACNKTTLHLTNELRFSRRCQ